MVKWSSVAWIGEIICWRVIASWVSDEVGRSNDEVSIGKEWPGQTLERKLTEIGACV